MKWFASCLVVLAVAGLGQCQSSSEELLNMKLKVLRDYMREKQALDIVTRKVEEVCPGYGNKFEAAFEKVQKCTNDINEDSETICSTIQNHLEVCSRPIVKLFEECLPEKSKDLPAFIIQTVLSASDYICKADGEHIFELYNPCVKSYNYRTQRCIRKIQSKLQQYSSTTPSKYDICEFSSSMRGCLESHLQHSCGNVKTREAFLNLYSAIQKPCGSTSLNEIDDMSKPRREWVGAV